MDMNGKKDIVDCRRKKDDVNGDKVHIAISNLKNYSFSISYFFYYTTRFITKATLASSSY